MDLAFAEEKKIAIISNMIDMPENNDRLSQQNIAIVNNSQFIFYLLPVNIQIITECVEIIIEIPQFQIDKT